MYIWELKNVLTKKIRIKKSSLYEQLLNTGANTRRFQDPQLKTVGGVVFTIIC